MRSSLLDVLLPLALQNSQVRRSRERGSDGNGREIRNEKACGCNEAELELREDKKWRKSKSFESSAPNFQMALALLDSDHSSLDDFTRNFVLRAQTVH